MQFLFDAHQDGLLATPAQEDEALASYARLEPAAFQELMATARGDTKARGEYIRRLKFHP